MNEVTLPCVEALLAGTLALMTAFAGPMQATEAGACTRRRLIARKVVSNLFFLREHPSLSAGMRQVVANVHRHWLVLADGIDQVGELQGRSAAADDDVPPPTGTLH